MDGSDLAYITLPLMFVGFAAAAASVIILPFFLHNRTKDRTRLYEMLKQAQESNHPFSPELIRQLVGSRPPSRDKDIRRGAILLAITFGLALQILVAQSMIKDIDARSFVIALLSPFISVLGCVGLTLVVLGLALRRPDKNRSSAD